MNKLPLRKNNSLLAKIKLFFAALLLLSFGSAHADQGRAGKSEEANTVTSTQFGPIKQIKAGLLNVGYVEAGPASGEAVILLHGWPYDISSYSEVTNILAAKGYHVLVPYLRGYGTTTFLSASTKRNGQQAAVAEDIIAFMDALKIKKAILGGYDWGARTADIIAAIWPERVKGLVSVSGYLIGSQAGNKAPLPPKAELAWWYQFYFATDRGAAGYAANTAAFNKLIWQQASPKWNFSDSTYEQSAKAFSNPDHVKVVIDNYRWRLGLTKGEPKYDALEKKLAAAPVILVPTVTLEGDANGAPHPDPSQYANKFKGKYVHHTINGGIGHDLPQEAPQAFADAIAEVDSLAK
jgi:pimeloyl-ACP methyl ester carboxylesterase